MSAFFEAMKRSALGDIAQIVDRCACLANGEGPYSSGDTTTAISASLTPLS